MSNLVIPNTFVPGTEILAAPMNANFVAVRTIINGQIDNTNIASGANISISKLALNPGGPAFNKAAPGTQTWANGLTTDTVPSVSMISDGGLQFGPGAGSALDVRLIRNALNTLQLATPSGAAAVLDMNVGAIINLHTVTMDGATAVLNMNGGSITNVGSLSGPNPANAALNGFRASISAGSALPADGTSSNIFWLPYINALIGLYNGTGWSEFTIPAGLSIAVPATTDTGYDIAVDYNSGAPVLALFAWPNLTTPPARAQQDGVWYTGGNARYRLIGSFCTGATVSQTSDRASERYLDNIYNKEDRPLFAQVPVASWAYALNVIRASNANVTNGQGRFSFFKTFANYCFDAWFNQPYLCGTTAATVLGPSNGIGFDTVTAFSSANSSLPSMAVAGATITPGGVNPSAFTGTNLGAGRHFVQMLEQADAGPKSWTFYGNGNPGHSLTGRIAA